MRMLILVSVVLAMSSASATAVVLRNVEGGVSLNRGSGYSRTATPTVVKFGDRIKTSANGSAELVYDNGCIYQIAPNQRIRVGEEEWGSPSLGSLKDSPNQKIQTCDAVAPALAGAIVPSAFILGAVGGIVAIVNQNPTSP